MLLPELRVFEWGPIEVATRATPLETSSCGDDAKENSGILIKTSDGRSYSRLELRFDHARLGMLAQHLS